MPNPITLPQFNTSKKVKVVEAITPIPEGAYEGDNNPYRGIENHGVEAHQEPYLDYADMPDVPMIEYEPELDGPDAIPVRIVRGEYKREFRRMRTQRITVGGVGTQSPNIQLVGRNDSRTTLTVLNTDATNAIYIATTPEELNISGYPLTAGKERTITSEDPVWAMSPTGLPVVVGLIWEYSVSDK